MHACAFCKHNYKRLEAHPVYRCRVLEYLDTHYPLDEEVLKVENDDNQEEPEEVPPPKVPRKAKGTKKTK